MRKNFCLILLFFVLGSYSCSKNTSTVTVNNQPKPLNVYVAGYRVGIGVGGDVDTATYWKNGAPIALSNGLNNAHATAIALSGSNVYVSGDSYIGNNAMELAVYWLNGNQVSLTNGAENAYGSSVAVSGNNVYVGGYEFSSVGKDVALYWENGNPVELTDSTKNAYGYAITVSGSDVYLAGYENSTTTGFGNDIAMYWKDGNPVPLTDGTQEAQAYGIAVSGSDVYVVGYIFNGNTYLATIWKDGTATTLNDVTGSPATDAWSVFVSGSDVYVAGQGASGALFWKDGVSTSLGGGAQASATGIAVSDTSIFVAGNIDVIQFVSNSSVYWNNGTPVTLNDGLKFCNANAIFVSTQ